MRLRRRPHPIEQQLVDQLHVEVLAVEQQTHRIRVRVIKLESPAEPHARANHRIRLCAQWR